MLYPDSIKVATIQCKSVYTYIKVTGYPLNTFTSAKFIIRMVYAYKNEQECYVDEKLRVCVYITYNKNRQ